MARSLSLALTSLPLAASPPILSCSWQQDSRLSSSVTAAAASVLVRESALFNPSLDLMVGLSEHVAHRLDDRLTGLFSHRLQIRF